MSSDIDLVIEGGDILAAMAVAEASSFHTDVVDLDLLRPEFRTRILEEGKVYHGSKG